MDEALQPVEPGRVLAEAFADQIFRGAALLVGDCLLPRELFNPRPPSIACRSLWTAATDEHAPAQFVEVALGFAASAPGPVATATETHAFVVPAALLGEELRRLEFFCRTPPAEDFWFFYPPTPDLERDALQAVLAATGHHARVLSRGTAKTIHALVQNIVAASAALDSFKVVPHPDFLALLGLLGTASAAQVLRVENQTFVPSQIARNDTVIDLRGLPAPAPTGTATGTATDPLARLKPLTKLWITYEFCHFETRALGV